jgi:hypothetical protein
MRRFHLAAGVAVLLSSATLHAHRTEGLLQSALVDVQPDQIEVQVVIQLGSDIAGNFVKRMDTDQDRKISATEQTTFSQAFLHDQRITIDGNALPITHTNTDTSTLEELHSVEHGHAQIHVHFKAKTPLLLAYKHIITHENKYEPIPCIYQTHGIIPKAPSVRIMSHSRDDREQALRLETEFSRVAKAFNNPLSEHKTFHHKNSRGIIMLTLITTAIVAAAMIFIRRNRKG